VSMSEADPPRLDAHAGLTADRQEHKYLLPAARARAFAREVAAVLPPQLTPGGVERAEQRVKTVYFDTERLDLYRAALSEPSHVKVRARSYRDARTGRATRRSGIDLGPVDRTRVYVELKTRTGHRSCKRRACIHQAEVERFFDRLEVPPEAGELDVADRLELDAIADELRSLRARLGRLGLSCVVSYTRVAFEHPGLLRVTLDRDIRAFAPSTMPWASGVSLAHEDLGAPVLEERACVVEVKSRDALPAWLEEVLLRHEARTSEYSKFVLASQAVRASALEALAQDVAGA
jgi:hypothetical protein